MIAAKAVLEETKSFLSSDKMHAKLAKIALLSHGAQAMAGFAEKGNEEKGYVDQLLSDDSLIVEMMELGGAYENKYGQAMRNYQALLKASKNARTNASAGEQKGFYRLWALASSLEHPDGNYVPKVKVVGLNLGAALKKPAPPSG